MIISNVKVNENAKFAVSEKVIIIHMKNSEFWLVERSFINGF
jgi:hypothetical protein